MHKKTVLDKLGEVVFHDLPLEDVRITGEGMKTMTLLLTPYNELKKGYDWLELNFLTCTKIKFIEFELDADSSWEVFSFEYSWQEFFVGELVIIPGWAKAPIKIQIECLDLTFTLSDLRT